MVKTNSQTLLLVEDDPNDKLFFERALSQSTPVNIVSVTDGEQAILYLQGSPPYEDRNSHPLPQLVILDLKLPRRNGHEVLAWIKGESPFPELPVVIFTSSDQLSDIEAAYSLGANSYLVKPVGFENLVDTVQTISKYWLENNHFPLLSPEP